MFEEGMTSRQREVANILAKRLSEKFGVSADLVSFSMRHNVEGLEGGKSVCRDHMVLHVSQPVVGREGEFLFSIPVQHDLASVLSTAWKRGAPLLEVNIPLPDRPSRTSQAKGSAVDGEEGVVLPRFAISTM